MGGKVEEWMEGDKAEYGRNERMKTLVSCCGDSDVVDANGGGRGFGEGRLGSEISQCIRSDVC